MTIEKRMKEISEIVAKRDQQNGTRSNNNTAPETAETIRIIRPNTNQFSHMQDETIAKKNSKLMQEYLAETDPQKRVKTLLKIYEHIDALLKRIASKLDTDQSTATTKLNIEGMLSLLPFLKQFDTFNSNHSEIIESDLRLVSDPIEVRSPTHKALVPFKVAYVYNLTLFESYQRILEDAGAIQAKETRNEAIERINATGRKSLQRLRSIEAEGGEFITLAIKNLEEQTEMSKDKTLPKKNFFPTKADTQSKVPLNTTHPLIVANKDSVEKIQQKIELYLKSQDSNTRQKILIEIQEVIQALNIRIDKNLLKSISLNPYLLQNEYKKAEFASHQKLLDPVLKEVNLFFKENKTIIESDLRSVKKSMFFSLQSKKIFVSFRAGFIYHLAKLQITTLSLKIDSGALDLQKSFDEVKKESAEIFEHLE